MIQDIAPHVYRNEYKNVTPTADSFVLAYRGSEILLKHDGENASFWTFGELSETVTEWNQECRYLFEIDGVPYFLTQFTKDQMEKDAFTWDGLGILRTTLPKEVAFGGITGHQLYDWYKSRQFCPRCGSRTVHDEKERMMKCPSCGQMEYPKICPAVIVGVTNGDKILLTKYAGRDYTRYALIAGFAEIGESIEETVKREVMEEVGLKVKNLRYYKSQPWSFSSTLLMGFFAELDGADEITLDEEELSVGVWCQREDVPEDDGVSLTREMMRAFRENRV